MRVCIGDALNSYGGSQTARTSIWLITYKISIGLCSRVSFRVVSTWGLTVYIIAKDPNCLSVQGLLCDNERRITKTRKTGPVRKWDNQVMRARRSRIKSLSPQHSTLSFCVYFVSAITADGKWLAENDNVNSNEILQLWTGEDKTRPKCSMFIISGWKPNFGMMDSRTVCPFPCKQREQQHIHTHTHRTMMAGRRLYTHTVLDDYTHRHTHSMGLYKV